MGLEDKHEERMAAWAEATLVEMKEKAGEEVAKAEMAAWEAAWAEAEAAEAVDEIHGNKRHDSEQHHGDQHCAVNGTHRDKQIRPRPVPSAPAWCR